MRRTAKLQHVLLALVGAEIADLAADKHKHLASAPRDVPLAECALHLTSLPCSASWLQSLSLSA